MKSKVLSLKKNKMTKGVTISVIDGDSKGQQAYTPDEAIEETSNSWRIYSINFEFELISNKIICLQFKNMESSK